MAVKVKEEKDAPVIKHVWQNSTILSLTRESSQVIQAGAARRTYDAYGEGITWAVLDSGIDRSHEHFREYSTIEAHWDYTKSNVRFSKDDLPEIDTETKIDNDRDHSGHGTHVSAILAGWYEGEKGVYAGIAPRTKIHSYRVLDETGRGREASVIRALEHIYEKNASSQSLVIHGVNLSLGNVADPAVYGCGHSAICREVRRLWMQGVVVCVAAGNTGMVSLLPGGSSQYRNVNLDISIGDPANLEECIAVGSVHKRAPHSYGVSYFSSKGPTSDGRTKPDCVAPGERIVSADAGSVTGYRADSGTSMACPHVSGIIAAFLSKKREFIGQPDRVKGILKECCIDIKRDRYHQGAGIPNLMDMLLRF